jgi:hypothetical protein
MRCPACGLEIEPSSATHCPRCGQPLYDASPTVPNAAAQPLGTTAAANDTTPLSPPDAPPPPAAPGNPPGGYPAYPSAYGSGYVPPAPPNYPSSYPPAYPLPGYQSPWGPPNMQPPAPPAPPAPRKTSTALIVGSIVAVVVIVIAAIAVGGVYLLRTDLASPAAGPMATATAVATPTPLMPGMNGRTLLVDDPLPGSTPSWPNGAHCFARADGYHITNDYFCYSGEAYVGDATSSVRAELFAGPANLLYGIAFRIQNTPQHFAFYFFGISSAGTWTFGRDVDGTWTPIVVPQASAAIQQGIRVFSTLTVNATGSHFLFYIGQTLIGSADDTKLTKGYTGLTVFGTGEAVFTNFMVAN